LSIPKKEAIAVREGRRLNIPIVALLDTNCDPDEVDYIIPGNDDAIRAIRLISSRIAEACIEGRKRLEEKQQAEADKELEAEAEATGAGAELKPGERKIISEGAEGPVVEVIRRGTSETGEDAQTEAPGKNAEAEQTGE
jgi:small subunit ribosomal protein S2